MSAAALSPASWGIHKMPVNENNEWLLLGENDDEILSFSSMLELEVENGGAVPSEVLEQGGFAAYNKTQEPLKIAVSLGIEGDPADLQSALAALKTLKEETTKFSLVTPEFEYVGLTLESFSYGRKREEGRGVLYVQLNLVEVREAETATTTVKLPKSKCKNADCASQKNNGKGQAQGFSGDSSTLRTGTDAIGFTDKNVDETKAAVKADAAKKNGGAGVAASSD